MRKLEKETIHEEQPEDAMVYGNYYSPAKKKSSKQNAAKLMSNSALEAKLYGTDVTKSHNE